MNKLKGVVGLRSDADYLELYTNGKLTYDDVEIIYDENTVYVTDEDYDLSSIITPIKEDIGELQADVSDLQSQIDDIDLSAYVDRQSVQEISGVKTFVEQIGIKNTDGTTDYIKHINNNLLISTSTGTNLFNIDEGLSKVYAFNKELAFKTDISSAGGTKIYYEGVTDAIDSITFKSNPQTQINSINNSLTDYVTLNTEQKITSKKFFVGDSAIMALKSNSINLATLKKDWAFIDFRDVNDNRIGIVGATQRDNGYYGMYMQAGNEGSISIYSNGTSVVTYVPTPPHGDVGTSIANTKFVRDDAFAHTVTLVHAAPVQGQTFYFYDSHSLSEYKYISVNFKSTEGSWVSDLIPVSLITSELNAGIKYVHYANASNRDVSYQLKIEFGWNSVYFQGVWNSQYLVMYGCF